MRHDPIDPGKIERPGRGRPAGAARDRLEPRVFTDRAEAGRELAGAVAAGVKPPCVVAAVPRGGVTVALPIAERLGAPLTVVYARKLTAPLAPELAFGALDEDGQMLLDETCVTMLGLRAHDVEKARARVAAEIRRRMDLYGAYPLARYLPGAAVVLVDDGLATGLTMRAAVAHARRHGARQVVVAVPCASAEAALRFRHEADRFVSLVVDDVFKAVGAYYLDFAPVPDHQVLAMLARARSAPAAPGPSRLRLAFKNARGLRLAGELFLPEVTGRPPVVVFAHGWRSTKDSPRNRLTAEALCRAGIAAFVFDFTGHGESDGAEEDATPDQEVEDLHAAIDVAERLDEIDAARLGVLGASSGAAVALRVAAETPKVRALVLRSANPEGSETAVARVTVPTLLVAGAEDDRLVATSQQLRAGLGGPARLAVVAKGDHAFTDPRALAEAVRLSVEWFREHLEARPT